MREHLLTERTPLAREAVVAEQATGKGQVLPSSRTFSARHVNTSKGIFMIRIDRQVLDEIWVGIGSSLLREHTNDGELASNPP